VDLAAWVLGIFYDHIKGKPSLNAMCFFRVWEEGLVGSQAAKVDLLAMLLHNH